MHNFNWDDWIVVTDKIDGTTVQADNKNVYKRRDRFKKGDPRKFKATEEERYYLKQLEEEEPQNKWIFKAFNRYREPISHIEPSYNVYFECFGDKIQARYKGRPQDIRVFDFAIEDKYLPFETTIDLCNSFNIPIVGYTYKKLSGVKEIIETLPEAKHIDSELQEYELEGWVLRQGKQIAKIRKTDLKKLTKEEVM